MTLWTIAGFDPSSGAGITADLAVFRAMGRFGVSAITALTVQSTQGVFGVEPVDAGQLSRTLECLAADLPPDGIKIGMLATAQNVAVVADFLRRMRDSGNRAPVVLDPVLRSSSGRALLNEDGTERLKRELLPLVDWVTPNLAEMAVLCNLPVETPAEMESAAAQLQARLSGLGVIVTGGHSNGFADDLVVGPGSAPEWLRGERIASRATHGTGCAFSSAMLCGLVAGLDGGAAARASKEYVAGAIRHAVPRGKGRGPMNLAWRSTGQP